MNARATHPVSRPETISEQVYLAIRQAIVNKSLEPGSVVTEAQLAADLEVSKTPVREALLRLKEIGLVHSLGARGVAVIEPSSEGIQRAYEVRWTLEGGMARLAAMRASVAQKAQLAATAQASLDAARRLDPAAFSAADQVFHRAMWAAGDNPDLLRLTDNAYALTSTLRARDAVAGGDSIHCAEQHVEIAAMVSAGDQARASELTIAHVQDVFKMVAATHSADREAPTRTSRSAS